MTESAKIHWESWLDTKVSYCDSRRAMNKFINKIAKKENKTIYDVVDLEKTREMKRELIKTEEEIEKKILYSGFDAFSDEDIKNSKLTEVELRVMNYKCKKHYSFREIAIEFNWTPSTVFEIYENAKKKIEKYKKLRKENKVLNVLTTQQKNIYKLIKEGKNNMEIASELRISIGSVKKQKNRMENKLKGLTKYPNS
jgi:DNA-binding NarL/FixJ family response regulator